MKTIYRITRGNEAMSAMGYCYAIYFDIVGKGSTTEQKDLHLGETKTLEQAIKFIKEKMLDPYNDEIKIDHLSGSFEATQGGTKNMNDLKIFVCHKPSCLGHVINVCDLEIEDVSELSDHGVCDLISPPAVLDEIINSFGESHCRKGDAREEDFEVTYYREL